VIIVKMLSPALSAVAMMILFTTGRAQRVRLVGGDGPYEGRLEVYYNGRWGTVCDDYFSDVAAGVVCYMLGYGRVGRFIRNRYGAGSGTIWLHNVRCSGSETNIADCSHRGWGIHGCRHYEDVSVSCLGVRLVGGESLREGRLEVYYNGTWGTVCDDGFNDAAARVVCYSLGYGRIGRSAGNRYGAGNGTIWLDELRCNGRETSIADCSHRGWGNHSCSHSQDASVSCPGVRLVGGPSSQEGRLEVFHDGIWGTVCGDYFNDAAATVVCYMLGYGYFGHFLSRSYGAGSGQIWLDNVQCNGTETNIADCQHNGWGSHDCHHGEDVSVSCVTVMLVEGSSPLEGRLEVRYKATWGTVCDDYFDNAAATVVCDMLGYKHTGQFIGNRYGAGNGTIWLDDIRCDGTERHISECSHRAWGFHNCEHHEDVSVSCVGDSSASTTRTSYPDMMSLSPTSSTRSTSSPSSTVTSTASTQSDRIDGERTKSSSPTSSVTSSTMKSSSTESSTVMIPSSLTPTKMTSSPSSSTSSVTSTTMTPSPTLSITRATAAIQSGSNHDGPDVTQIIIAVIVVIGLITCVIVIGLVVHSRQNPRRDRTEAAVIPMSVAAVNSSNNNDAFDDTTRYQNPPHNSQASDNNAYSDFQQPSAPVAGAVGGVGPGDKYEESSAVYETLSDDKGQP